jgi:hypothetical protein
MNDVLIQPDVLLAFTPAANLAQLTTERDNVQKAIMSNGCNPQLAFGLTLDWLKSYAEKGTGALLIFHYGGHASPEGLEYNVVEGDENKRVMLPYADLAAFMESFNHLKMVFINGCDSAHAADFFLKKADVLICTNKPVNDEMASKFAHIFYSNFLKINDLDNAFTTTRSFVSMGGGRGTSDFQRGAMSTAVLNQGGPSVFELKYRDNNAELGKATFQSWRQIIQPNLTQAKETAVTTKNMGVQNTAYLLCNRRKQAYFFSEGLKKKQDNPQPLFFFIHGLNKHCPFDLFTRFVKYTLPEALGIQTPTTLELPSAEFSDLDKCKLELLDKYCRKGGFGKENTDRTWSLTKRVPDNQFIVIHHELTDAEWADNWAEFWAYYTTEFSKELVEKLSEKLIIITTRVTSTEQDDFTTYFEKMAADPTKQAVSISNFGKITQKDVDAWQIAVFNANEFDSSTIVPQDEERFFSEIRDLLKARL